MDILHGYLENVSVTGVIAPLLKLTSLTISIAECPRYAYLKIV